MTNAEKHQVASKHSNVCHLTCNVFSTLHAKRGSITDEKANLKSDLNLTRIVWNEIGLSCTPKFYVLCEHAPDLLRKLSEFYDIGEDAIERLHQIRLRHFARIRNLRIIEKQKENQAKHEEIKND